MNRFKIIAYFPSWTGDPAQVPYEKLTHVNFSFVRPTPEGALGGFDGKGRPLDLAKLAALVAGAHRQGVKVGLAVGGWSGLDNRDFEAAAKAPVRSTFVANLVDFCRRHDLDGVDMDWEYPTAASAADFAALMHELGRALHAEGKELSAAVIAKDTRDPVSVNPGGVDYAAHIFPSVFADLDMLNIMAYDWYFEREGTHHSSYALAEESLDYWLDRGCPPEKAVLGVPFYGRSPSKSASYRDLVARDPALARLDQAGPAGPEAIHYNGILTMERKTELAMRKGGGIMFWEVTQDTTDATSLLGAIHATASKK